MKNDRKYDISLCVIIYAVHNQYMGNYADHEVKTVNSA